VASRIAKTFQVLTTTRNESALDVLLWGLESGEPHIRDAALRGLIERRSAAGHRQLVARWHTFPENWKALLVERSGRVEGALRAAILSTDFEVHRNACDAVVEMREYDLVPTLLIAAEDKGNAHAQIAARAAVELCSRLYQELSSPRDYRKRRDPVLVRQYLYSSLEHSVSRFEQHGRQELVEAFLLLARPDDSLLKRCLQQSHERLHTAVIQLLSTSTKGGLLRLVLSNLEDPQAPPALLGVVTRRRDLEFLRPLFLKFRNGVTPAAKVNLRRLTNLAWLRDDAAMLASLSPEEQPGMIQLVVASAVNRLRVFELLQVAMRNGQAPCRRAACDGLAEFRGGDANQLVLTALDDPDAHVQAAAVAQIRDRGIRGVVHRLVELVDSPHELVREAARASLTEFSFQRYLGAFDMLQPEIRRSTGALVKRVDPQALDQLATELESPARSRRLRGIEVAVAMGAVQELEQHIVQLAHDDDHFIRAETARTLVHIDPAIARPKLQELLLDRSVSVREAAGQSLSRLALPPGNRSPSAPIIPPGDSLSTMTEPLGSEGIA
jgi:HEAT repeat protein